MSGIRLLLAGALVLGGLSGRARAQAIPVTVGAGASSIIGKDFDLPLVVDMSARSDKLGSFSVSLRWDPAVLQLITGQDGTFGPVETNEDSVANGLLLIAGANPAGVGGLVTLGVGRFRPLASDTTTFQITVHELYAAGTFADLTPDVVVVTNQYCPGRGRYGDVDPDGVVDSRDGLIALMESVGLDVSAYDIDLADVDADGNVDPRDALVILSYGIGLDVSGFRVFTIAPGGICAPAGGLTYTMTPGDVSVLVDQGVQYVPTAVDSAGSPVAIVGLSWTTTDAAVATVDSVGLVTALAPGSTVIAALQDSSVVGTVTVTVVASRGTHWVDALAAGALNRIGSRVLPFDDVASALAVAGASDTIRILPGRYEENITITQPQVVLGDTVGGGVAPLIAATGPFTTGIDITAPGRVELRNLRLDTLWIGVQVFSADTVLVKDVEFRAVGSNSFASIHVDTVTALIVEGSRFFGDATPFGNNAINVLGGAGLVRVDSSLIADFGDYGIELFNVDSLSMRGNVVRDNYGYGVYTWSSDSTRAIAASLVGNRFERNGFGQLYLGMVRSAAFDHNVLLTSSGGSQGLFVGGFTQTVASLLGDSIVARQADWLWMDAFDSLHVDSVSVQQQEYGGGYLYQGRAVVVRNSTFTGFPNFEAAIDFGASVVSGATMTLRNLSFSGPDSSVCNRCAYGALWTNVSVDADSITGVNLYTLLRQLSGSLVARNLDITDASAGIRSRFCGGPVRVSNMTGLDVETGIHAEACTGQDSLVVDSVDFARGTYGVYSSAIPVVVTNSSFTDYQYGIYHFDSTLVATDNHIVRPRNYGIYADFNGSGGSISALRNAVTCDAFGAVTALGIEVFDGPSQIVQDTITGCQVGIEAGDFATGVPVSSEIRDNVVATPGSANAWGIRNWGYYDASQVVGNTVTGLAARGAIVVASSWLGAPAPRADVDSNTVDGALCIGIQTFYADTLMIRDNAVRNVQASTCNVSGASGGGAAIVLSHSTPTDDVAEIRRNRITDVKTHGIVLARDFNDSVVVIVDSNTVKRADSVGIWIADYSSALIRYNAIDSAMHDAVQTSRFNSTGTTGSVILNQNNFTNSGRYGVRNTVTWEWIDATNNWWNDPNGPSGFYGDSSRTSIGDSVSNFVIWSPVLTSPANTPAPAAPLGAPRLMATAGNAARAAAPPDVPAPGAGAQVPILPRDLAPRVPQMPSVLERQPRVLLGAPAPWLERLLERDRQLDDRLGALRERRRARLLERAKSIEAFERQRPPTGGPGRPEGGAR
jgi:hypothetical protein